MPMSQPSRRRILLVEDDRMVRETLTLMLDDDYEVLVAASVAAGMAHLSSPEAPAIDVLLLDCLLPDGRISEILAAADERSIPAVLISGDPRQADVLEPARCFLSKPFSQATLLFVLDSARR